MTVTIKETPENQLQQWFVRAALGNTVVDSIRNKNELQCEPDGADRSRSDTERNGLAKAARICEILETATFIAGDKSISPRGYEATKPDLLLLTSTAHPVLVELKTKKNAEREGVQELLAYSAAMKMQSPFLNEILYIIIAGHWTTLLDLSVRELIHDGKHVLPLRWFRDGDDFHFDIRTELFKFEQSEPYEAMQALVPHTFWIEKPVGGFKKDDALVYRYFSGLLSAIYQDCARLRQSGFVAIYSLPVNSAWEAYTLAVATVDQNWLWHRGLSQTTGVERDSKAKGYRKIVNQVFQGALGPGWGCSEDFFEDAAAYQRALQFRPSSTLSYDLVAKYRIEQEEAGCLERFRPHSPHTQFDERGFEDLSQYLNGFSADAEAGLTIRSFLAFGDLEAFRKNSWRGHPETYLDLFMLLDAFSESKKAPERAVTVLEVDEEGNRKKSKVKLRLYPG